MSLAISSSEQMWCQLNDFHDVVNDSSITTHGRRFENMEETLISQGQSELDEAIYAMLQQPEFADLLPDNLRGNLKE